MAQLDKIHNTVKNALVKDGWTITADPYRIEFAEFRLYADLSAERPIAAVRENEKIVVEIKSFLNRSSVSDFETALVNTRFINACFQNSNPKQSFFWQSAKRLTAISLFWKPRNL